MVQAAQYRFSWMTTWSRVLPEKLIASPIIEPEDSIPCSQGPATGPYPNPRPYITFHNKLVVYSEEMSAPSPAPKLENRPLSAIRD